MWALLSGLMLWLGIAAGQEVNPDSLQVDSLQVDSLSIDLLIPLDQRARAQGARINSFESFEDKLWLCGDSCLVGRLENDSTLTELDPVDDLPLHSILSHGGRLLSAGAKGRIFHVDGDTLLPMTLDDDRDILAMASGGGRALFCGESGLLGRLAGRTTWEVLDAPLPMRFYSIRFAAKSWWLGGAGGRVYRSLDQGDSWDLAWRDPDKSAVIQLAVDPTTDDLLVLLRSGRILNLDREGDSRILKEEDGQEWLGLLPRPNGEIFLGGFKGQLLGYRDGAWIRGQVPGAGAFQPLAWEDGLVAGASWKGLYRLDHDLGGHEKLGEQAIAEQQMPEDTEGLGSLTDSSLVASAYTGARLFQNVLVTDARLTTSPTRIRQLNRSYHPAQLQGVGGLVVLALDLGINGSLEKAHILEEDPPGIGFAEAALKVVENLSFTPGFGESGMAGCRILHSIQFDGREPTKEPEWSDPEVLLDSLLALQPEPFSMLGAKEFYKQMKFPRKAKRYVWKGDVLLDYLLLADGSIQRPLVLEEPDIRYKFGEHAIERLPRLEMVYPDSLDLLDGQVLRVVQKLHFDRKAGKEARRGAVSSSLQEVLLALPFDTTSSYAGQLDMLEWLLNAFSDPGEPGSWNPAQIKLVLRQDGRIHELTSTPISDQGSDIDSDLLFSLAYYFTWGRPVDGVAVESLDTLSIVWEPETFEATSSNMPEALGTLLDGVEY